MLPWLSDSTDEQKDRTCWWCPTTIRILLAVVVVAKPKSWRPRELVPALGLLKRSDSTSNFGCVSSLRRPSASRFSSTPPLTPQVSPCWAWRGHFSRLPAVHRDRHPFVLYTCDGDATRAVMASYLTSGHETLRAWERRKPARLGGRTCLRFPMLTPDGL